MVIGRLRAVVRSRDGTARTNANGRRQNVLRQLPSARSVRLGELANRIAAWERERDRAEEDDASTAFDHWEAVYASLYLTHVPTLADAGLVRYDPETERISLTDRGLRVRSGVTVTRGDSAFWSRLFVVQSLAWVSFAFALYVELPAVGSIPPTWILVGCLCTFGLTSIGYAWKTHRLLFI